MEIEKETVPYSFNRPDDPKLASLVVLCAKVIAKEIDQHPDVYVQALQHVEAEYLKGCVMIFCLSVCEPTHIF